MPDEGFEADGFARKQNVNRENKLAIIIGFSLVLVVAVLISDHFSRARTVEVGSEMKPGTPEDFGASTVGLTRPIGNQDIIPASDRPLSEVEQRIQHVAVRPEVQPDEFTMGGQLAPKSEPTAPQPAGQGEIKIVDPQTGPTPLGPTPLGPTGPAVPAKPFSDGVMRFHEVKEGDKLFRIAARYYGDGAHWQALATYNKTKLPKPENLRVGVKLDIPPKDVLLGEATMPPASAPGAKPKANPAKESTGGRPKGEKPVPVAPQFAGKDKPKADKSKKSAYDTYKIARGDDLSSIAKKLLGDAKRAGELYKLNKDVLEDENTLLAGTVIKVPMR